MRATQTKILIVISSVFILLAALTAWLNSSKPPAVEPNATLPPDVTEFSQAESYSDIEPSSHSIENIEEPGLRAREQEILSSLPRSLRGTDINGGFQVDADGHLIISSANRDFFEYFLSTLGEESLEQVMDRITEIIELRLVSPAQEEAINLLKNYINLKRALVDFEQQVGNGLDQYGNSPLAQHRARLDMMSELRRQYLGEEAAQAFYGESEDYDRYMLDRMSLTSNSSMSSYERTEALVKLMEEAPESLKPRLEDDYKMQKLNLDVENLKASGASEEDIYQARAEILGEEAASRLQQVEQAQSAWNNRYQAYQSEKALLISEGLSEAAYAEEVNALQQRMFEDNELRRVKALDRINADKK